MLNKIKTKIRTWRQNKNTEAFKLNSLYLNVVIRFCQCWETFTFHQCFIFIQLTIKVESFPEGRYYLILVQYANNTNSYFGGWQSSEIPSRYIFVVSFCSHSFFNKHILYTCDTYSCIVQHYIISAEITLYNMLL